MGLRIDIGVGGRFHADEMTRALLAHGHDVTLYSSFPRSRFASLPPERVRPLLAGEVLFRALRRLRLDGAAELTKMRVFGSSLARSLRRSTADCFIGWSSFSKEALERIAHRHKILVRDSAHIATQMQILRAEYHRLGLPFRFPEANIARETAEYALADRILVLSEFARRSFVAHGIARDKIDIVRLGVDLTRFGAPPARRREGPLRVVYFGSISVQKGIAHLLEAVKTFDPREVSLTLIGAVERTLGTRLAAMPSVRHIPAQPQSALPALLAECDVFVMPTLQDGFGQTVIQAMASGLVPIATDACGAAECITPGRDGFVVPAGDAAALQAAIAALAADRARLAGLREVAIATARAQTWQRYGDTVADLISQAGTRKETRDPALFRAG